MKNQIEKYPSGKKVGWFILGLTVGMAVLGGGLGLWYHDGSYFYPLEALMVIAMITLFLQVVAVSE